MDRRARENERNARDPGDLGCYDTPGEATRALLATVRLPTLVWEPCAGKGDIRDVLEANGRQVVATDIRPRFRGIVQHDFFQPLPPKLFPRVAACRCIVTNPDFDMLPRGFIEQCLSQVDDVYLLLRVSFIAGGKPWRRQVLDKSGLRRIYVFADRLPMMHKKEHLEAGGKLSTSRMDFAWYWWSKGWRGHRSVHRMYWKELQDVQALPPPGPKIPKNRCKVTPDMFPAEVASGL